VKRGSAAILISALALVTAATLPVFLTGALAVSLHRSLGYSPRLVGFLVGVFFSCAIPGSILSGWFVDKLGASATVRGGGLIGCAAMALIGLAGRTPLTFGILLGVAGLADGAVQPAVNHVLSAKFPPARQGFAFGLKQSGIPASTFLAGLAVPVIALTIGWQWAYGAGALFALVAVATSPVKQKRMAQTRSPGGRGLPYGSLIVLALGMGCGAAAANGLGAFFISSSVRDGFSVATAGYLAALGSASSLFARILGGWLADRRSSLHFSVVAAMLGGGVIAYLGLASGEKAVVIPAAIFAYGLGWGWNGVFNFAVAKLFPHETARATGVTQAGAFLGGVVGPAGFGLIAAQDGFGTAWVACAAVALVAVVLVVLGDVNIQAKLGVSSERSTGKGETSSEAG